MPRRRVKCRQKTRSHQHHISPCIINQPFRSVSRLLFIPPIVVLQNGKKRAQMEKKAKQTRNRWQDFCFMFWGGKRKSRKMFSSSTILCFSFAIHPVMFESPAASLVPPESRSIFPPTPRSWEIPANFVFRAEFWLTLQLRNKLKQRRRKKQTVLNAFFHSPS